MAQGSQTYKNHVRWLPAFHFFVLPVLIANVFNQLSLLRATPTLGKVWAAVVAFALVMLALLSRIQANTVQDRVIRVEMRLRLKELLPADLKGRINDLTRDQLVALRFAGDAELPALVQDVLAGKLKTKKEIKMRVRDWQGDSLRA